MTKTPDFQETLKRMLNTPPKRHKRRIGERDMFVVINKKMMIVRAPKKNDDGSMTGALYRNLEDFENGDCIESSFSFFL